MSVKTLSVYQLAITNILSCEDLSLRLDRRLVDVQRQLLRAARSIPALITEGYAKKISQREFFRYILMALGSTDEVQTHLQMIMISRFNSIDQTIFTTLLGKYSLLARKLNCLLQTISTNIRYQKSAIRYPLSGRRKLTR